MRIALAVSTFACVAVIMPLGQALADDPAAAAGDRQLFERLDADGDGLVVAAEVSSEHRRLFDRLVRNSDADADGALDAKEFGAGLTPPIGEKPIEQQRSTDFRGAEATRLMLLKLDTNGDARLTRAEAPKELKEAFDQLVKTADRNKDKELDRAELGRSGPQLARQANQIARRMGIDVEKELRRVEAAQGSTADRFERTYDPREMLANPKQAAELYKQLDANRDGKLVASEVPDQARGRLEPLLRRADLDRSGDVSKREFLAAAERISALMSMRGGNAEPPSTRLAERGKKTPRQSSESEKASPVDDASSQVAGRLVRRMVQRLDRNRDGVVTRDEARGRMADRFTAADANGNGKLDAPELRALAASLGKRLEKADRKAAGESP